MILVHGTEVIILEGSLVEVYCKWLWARLRVVVMTVHVMSVVSGNPPALTLDNVVKVLNGGSVEWTLSLCAYGFRIPESKYREIVCSTLTSEEKLKASIDYMLSVDPTPSWRRIISAVDFGGGQYSAASRLYQYAEPVTGE